jgi:hypothetical protein
MANAPSRSCYSRTCRWCRCWRCCRCSPGTDSHVVEFSDTLVAVGQIILCIGIVVVTGRYLLKPFLALLAGGAREVMTAAALLVVLGAAASCNSRACRWRSARFSPA